MSNVTSRVDLYQSADESNSFCAALRWSAEGRVSDECFFDIQKLADEHSFTFENFCSLLFAYPYYKMEDHVRDLGLRAILLDPSTDPESLPESWIHVAEGIPEYIRTINNVPVLSIEDPSIVIRVKKQVLSHDAYFFIHGEYPES